METLEQVGARYRRELVENILPFWLKNGIDHENGGIHTALDRYGGLLDSDKSVWFQGRALWTFSRAYSSIGKNPDYLEAAETIARFLDEKCFDSDKRMFFRVTDDGRCVIKRLRYFFSEAFAVIGYAAYGMAGGNAEYCEKALKLYDFIERIRDTPGILVPKFDQSTRPTRSFSSPMILINVLAELRTAFPGKRKWFDEKIANLIDEIERYFVRPDLCCVLEECGPSGEFLKDHFEGRLLNPGHSIEGAWFIMNEGVEQENGHYVELGLKMLDWMFEKGWDDGFGGGIIQYRDALGLGLSEYHQDMKFWWPQCEAVIACLMAYKITGDERHLDRFRMVDGYISRHFIDNEGGEWFGYLHRDGTVASTIKGNFYKGPFHIPRMYIKAVSMLEGMSGQ